MGYFKKFLQTKPGAFQLRVVQGFFRKNSNDSWISDRVIVAVCFRSPFLNPKECMRGRRTDDKLFSIRLLHIAKPTVDAVRRIELVMRAAFDDSAMVHH